MTDSLFDPNNVQPPKNDNSDEGSKDYFSDLVGEGKKYKDQQALAKAYFEGDTFIEQLKREQAELRKDLEQRLTAEELMDRIEKKMNPASGDNSNRSFDEGNQNNSNENRKETNTIDELEELINNRLKQVEIERSRKQNISEAQRLLRESLGDSWEYEVSKKAKELGVSPEWLSDVAAQSPSALVKLVGNSAPKSDPNNVLPPRNTVFTGGANDSDVLTTEKLRAMRKADPKKYWSPAVQNQIMKLAAEGKLRP